MFEIRKANNRGVSHFPNLYSYHTFSFSSYQDPQEMGFSDLLVINDDIIAPKGGFETHSHNNMEIFTYVLEGALEHKDSMGTASVIIPGEVQIMSAGTGISHSEFNHSAKEPLHLLQIWIVPNQLNVIPRYQQQKISTAQKRGQLKLIISPAGTNQDSLPIYQDINIYAGLFDGIESTTFILAENRFAYLHIAKGSISINNHTLSAGDGVRIRQQQKLIINQGNNAEILFFDMRANELPQVLKI